MNRERRELQKAKEDAKQAELRMEREISGLKQVEVRLFSSLSLFLFSLTTYYSFFFFFFFIGYESRHDIRR